MRVARAIAKALYTTPDGVRMRFYRGLPYLWDGTCWPELARRDLRSAAYHYLENAWYFDDESNPVPWSPNRRKLDDLLDALEALTLIQSGIEPPLWIVPSPRDVRADEIVAMRNGLLHVPTRTLLPHTSRFFSHHALPFTYLADAPPPVRWLAFLNELWPDDDASVVTLQEVIGYLLAGGTALQKIFLMVGPKRAGKGTIARVLTGLLGPHNVAAPTLASLATNFGLSPLIGKPLAVVSDARLSPRAESSIVVERLLSVSGEDSLTVDRKYREPWTGRLPTRFFILTNELPRLTDASGALTSRFILLVLRHSFYRRENPRLTDELLVEAPSIFNWALEGYERLAARGHFEQPRSSEDAMQQLDDLASPMLAFLRARCVLASDARTGAEELWAEWKLWCEGEGRHAGTRGVFGRDLHAAVPTLRRGRPRENDNRTYAYFGIALKLKKNSSDVPGPLGPDRPSADPGPSGPSIRPVYGEPNWGAVEVDDGRV